MHSTIEKYKIEELLQLKKMGALTVNPEYQRGAVWNSTLQKKLIDSVLRGYPLPLIYLHHKKTSVANINVEGLEIIDGQQRLNALQLFMEGGLTLFDPNKDDRVARFPQFIKEQECAWAGKDYDSLTEGLRMQFRETVISVSKIETSYEDEARDLFIRLQSGLPLNSQEKRDAWPGGFTEFILKLGGKANNIRYPGDNFFKELVEKKQIDRGPVRTLAAQISMLYFEKATHDNWCEIGSSVIDDYYYRNLNFNSIGPDVNKFKQVLSKLYSLLGNRGIKKLKGHEAIHLVLFVDELMNDYSPSWESKLLPAFEEFRKEIIQAKRDKDGEYWVQYVQWTMTNSDTINALKTRHNVFTKKMYEKIKPQLLDPNRTFGNLEREIIYYRDNKRCPQCGSEIEWSDLEIHHIKEHQYGGQTVLENGIPVHKKCHPKGQEAIEFEKRYFNDRQKKNEILRSTQEQIAMDEDRLYLYFDPKKGIKAFGIYNDDTSKEFTVLKDSVISMKIDDSFGTSAATNKAYEMRTELIENEKIVERIFRENVNFNSVSLAAKVVSGGSRDGSQWKKVNN